jgi:hypothetical protein
MEKTTLSQATPEQLATFLSCEMPLPPWSSSDIATMWQQLSKASVLGELERSGAATPAMAQLCASASPPIVTFGDLMGHSTPPGGVIDAVRRMAKTQAASKENTGLAAVALALYYAILATAVITEQGATKLTPLQMAEGFQWTAAQPWLDNDTRELLRRAVLQVQKT